MSQSKKILAIIGAGDLGQQIAHLAITDDHYTTIVFFDDFIIGNKNSAHKIIGRIEDVVNAFNDKIFHELLIGIGYKHMEIRKNLFLKFKNIIPFGQIIHSTCIIDQTVILGVGNILYPGSILDANVVIGDNVLINIGTSIAHDSKIGSHSFVSPRVSLAGFVIIGEESILGINTVVVDNLTLGPRIQTGGGTLIIKNLLLEGLYVGSPSRFIR